MSGLKKAYIEITNVCNLRCPFCHGTDRQPAFMTPEQFRTVAEKTSVYTKYVYLHLLGEPLLHPRLGEILDVCRELELKTTVATNGVLLPEKAELLAGIYKLCVSLHSFEANGADRDPAEYIAGVCDAVRALSAGGTICALRLWNGGGENSLNDEIEKLVAAAFPGEYKKNSRGLSLGGKVYLEYGERFDWPDSDANETGTRFCMGLRDQIGVLADGTAVPCCLDADGQIKLGNLFTDDLGDILAGETAQALLRGFSEGRPAQELCRRCGFAAARFGTS